MFDIGFLELAIILILSLLVLGPERLPKAARTIGYWFGKARRYVEGMKSQVEAEFDTTEVKRLLHNQEVQIRELQSQLQNSESSTNNLFNIDDPGTGHVEGADKDPVSLEEANQEVSSEESRPAASQYEMIEETDDRWDELEASNRDMGRNSDEKPIDSEQTAQDKTQ